MWNIHFISLIMYYVWNQYTFANTNFLSIRILDVEILAFSFSRTYFIILLSRFREHIIYERNLANSSYCHNFIEGAISLARHLQNDLWGRGGGRTIYASFARTRDWSASVAMHRRFPSSSRSTPWRTQRASFWQSRAAATRGVGVEFSRLLRADGAARRRGRKSEESRWRRWRHVCVCGASKRAWGKR